MNQQRGWAGLDGQQRDAELLQKIEDCPKCRRCGESLMDDPNECKMCGWSQNEEYPTERSAD